MILFSLNGNNNICHRYLFAFQAAEYYLKVIQLSDHKMALYNLAQLILRGVNITKLGKRDAVTYLEYASKLGLKEVTDFINT